MLRTDYFNLFIVISSCLNVPSCLSQNVMPFSSDWNYDDSDSHGPSNWNNTYPTCGGSNQSPIDVNTSATQDAAGFINFDEGYNEVHTGSTFTLSNSGHGAQVSVAESTTAIISGGGLNGTYILEQFHFHWGETSDVGSEHTVNGKSYPLEIHLVHYQGKYGSVDNAVNSSQPDALAVLGVFVSETNDTNNANLSKVLGTIADSLTQIPVVGNETEITAFALSELLPDTCQRQYYRYMGGLTTPGCNEVVIWSVFRTELYITTKQMEAFRTSVNDSSGNTLTANYRPVQNINGRVVSFYDGLSPSCVTSSTSTTTPGPGNDISGARSLHAQCILFSSAAAIFSLLHIMNIGSYIRMKLVN